MTGNMTGSLTGKVFNNRYEVTERAGIGGMAEVYSAHDSVLDRTVAVKVMLPQYAADETFAKRFRQEAASAAALQSPYIVSIYDWGQDGNTYYIVMEYVRGSDLKTGIKERGCIHQRKVAEIGSQVAAALSEAHKHDIIHRDIKPQNIMIQPDGNAKVMDFGIARAGNSGLTQTNSVMGTAHYISPEQAQGKDLTPASDIYSLGVVMYEACTGKLPFDGPDAVSVALKQVSEMPPEPRTINPDIDPDLEGIIMMALAKDPADRFKDAQEMRQALNDYLAGRPVAALQNNQATKTAAAVAPIIAPLPVDSTQVMNPVGGGTAQGNNARTMSADAKNKNPKVSNPKKKMSGKKKAAIAIGVIAVIALLVGVAYAVFGSNTGNPVPDVTNKTLTEATTTIEQSGFKVGSVTRTYSDTVEEGKVISQDPTSGLKRTSGTSINLVVSQGAETVTVPNLSNMSAEEAVAALQRVGLKPVAGTATYSSTVEVGNVVTQNPASGQTVTKGSTVEYCLSLGVEMISVPNVVNYSESEARKTLENAGFTVQIQRGYSSTVDSGYVYSQDPSSGKLEAGDAVTIYISKGTDKTQVPNVYGYTAGEASNILKNKGFNAVLSEGDWSGTVYSQSPSSGSSAESGATVYLYARSSSNSNNSNSNANSNANNSNSNTSSASSSGGASHTSTR